MKKVHLFFVLFLSFSMVWAQQKPAPLNLPKFPTTSYAKVRAYKGGYGSPTSKTGMPVSGTMLNVLLAIVNDASTYGGTFYGGKPEAMFVFYDSQDSIVSKLHICLNGNCIYATPKVPAMQYHSMKGLSVHGNLALKDFLESVGANTLPSPPPATTPAPAIAGGNTGGGTVHTVSSGDTWYSIARKYGVPIGMLADANKCKTTNLPALSKGQGVKIPEITNQVIASRQMSGPTKEYQVQKSETLFSISKKFKTTPDVLKALNKLQNNVISEGMVIKVPK
ncbi:MAG: LysM peptidoglycan-binding domain-containing protein [Bacteroidia bacterium]